jgi:hypothetical protein
MESSAICLMCDIVIWIWLAARSCWLLVSFVISSEWTPVGPVEFRLSVGIISYEYIWSLLLVSDMMWCEELKGSHRIIFSEKSSFTWDFGIFLISERAGSFRIWPILLIGSDRFRCHEFIGNWANPFGGFDREMLLFIRSCRKVSDGILLSDGIGVSVRPTGSDPQCFTWVLELASNNLLLWCVTATL